MRISYRGWKIYNNYLNHIALLIILITCIISAFVENKNYVDANQYIIKGRTYPSVDNLYGMDMNYMDIYVDGNTPIERIDSLMFVSNHVTYHIDSFEMHPRRFRSYIMEYYCREKGINLPDIGEYETHRAIPTEKELTEWKRSFCEIYNNDVMRLSMKSNRLMLNGQNISAECLMDSLKKRSDRPLVVDMTNNNKISDLVAVYTFLMEAHDADTLSDLFKKKKILLLLPFNKSILQSIIADDAANAKL